MTILQSLIVFVAALVVAGVYAARRIGGYYSLGFMLFWSLIFIHGVPLLIYLFVTGPGAEGAHAFIFKKIQEQSNYLEISVNLINATSMMFVGIIVGSELAMRIGPKVSQSFSSLGMRGIIFVDKWREYFLWIVAISMMIVSILSSHITHIFNYYSFTGSELDRALLRLSTGGTPYYLYNVFVASVAPFFVMISYCHDVAARRKKYLPSVLTICLFAVVIIGKMGTLSKAPPVIFIAQLMLLTVLLKSSIIDFFGALKVSSLLIFLFLCMIGITLPELRWYEVVKFLYYRVFDIPNEVLLEYFSAIPAKIPHSWGASVWSWVGGDVVSNSRPTYYEVAVITRNSYLSTSNAMFIGDAWAQFSWWGVGLTSVLAGFWMQIIDRLIYFKGYSDLSACIIAAGAFGILTILSTAFSTGLVTGGLLLVPLVSMFFIDPKKLKGFLMDGFYRRYTIS